jgi:hypothetical protein
MPVQKGKKPVAWRRDPLILQRLVRVENLHLMNITNVAIGEQLGVTEATIRNDLKRLAVLWRERAGDDIQAQKDRSIAIYRKVQNEAFRAFQAAKDTSLNRGSYLNTIKTSEDSIAKVLGLAPDKHELSGPGGGAIPVREVVIHLPERDEEVSETDGGALST